MNYRKILCKYEAFWLQHPPKESVKCRGTDNVVVLHLPTGSLCTRTQCHVGFFVEVQV